MIHQYQAHLQRYNKRYQNLLAYHKTLQLTGKLRRMTRSQLRALQYRLNRSLFHLRKYIKLGIAGGLILSMNTTEVTGQCQRNLEYPTDKSFHVPFALTKPVFADLDDDGDMDAFIGVDDGTIKHLENVSGTFIEKTGTNNPLDGVKVGSHSAPAFIDIDGDADLDVVVGSYSYERLYFFENFYGNFIKRTKSDNPLFEIESRKPVVYKV